MTVAESDTEALVDAVLPFAKKMLARHGGFFPYAAAMKPNGEIVSIAAYDGREHPPSNECIEILTAELSKDATDGKYKATAVVYDVKVIPPGKTEKTDAIAIALDHRESYSVIALFPYSVSQGKVRVENPYAEKGNRAIFGHKFRH